MSEIEIMSGEIMDPDEVEFRRRYEEDIKRGNMYYVACTLSARLRSLDKKTRKTNERADRLQAQNSEQFLEILRLRSALALAKSAPPIKG